MATLTSNVLIFDAPIPGGKRDRIEQNEEKALWTKRCEQDAKSVIEAGEETITKDTGRFQDPTRPGQRHGESE